MKIALVIEHFDRRRGGAETWTCDFAQALLLAGHEVHVVARSVERLGVGREVVSHVVSGTSRLGFAAAAEAELRRHTFDAIHDMGSGWYCDVLHPHGGSRRASFERTLQLAPAWQRPWKRAAAHILPRYTEFARLTQRQYAAPRRLFLAVSQMVARDLQRWHQVPSEQIRLIYNGVDTERFSPDHRTKYREAMRQRLHIEPDETLLLIVAHNFQLKGVPTLLRALGHLRRTGAAARLVVVGGKRTRGAEQLAERSGVAPYVTFAGAIDDPVPYYAAADVYVQPTFYDPCSLVALEALASGLPVVTSVFNGAGELITSGAEGLIQHDPADDVELARLLLPLVERDAQQSMGTTARALALRHTWQHNVRAIVEVYGSLTQPTGTQPRSQAA